MLGCARSSGGVQVCLSHSVEPRGCQAPPRPPSMGPKLGPAPPRLLPGRGPAPVALRVLKKAGPSPGLQLLPLCSLLCTAAFLLLCGVGAWTGSDRLRHRISTRTLVRTSS